MSITYWSQQYLMANCSTHFENKLYGLFFTALCIQCLTMFFVSDIRLLFRTLPWCHIHHPHDASQSVLYYQPHLSLPPHLRRLLPRFLLASRVRRKSQSGNHNFAGARRLSANSRWDVATNAWCHPCSRSVAASLTARVLVITSLRHLCYCCIARSRHLTINLHVGDILVYKSSKFGFHWRLK